MTQRIDDLRLLNKLLRDHPDELTDRETEAFASMRFDLTAYDGGMFLQLTELQRAWVTGVHQRIVPEYANLVSRGLVPKGTPTAESKKLDAMLAGPKPLKPPPLPKPATNGLARASRKHCGKTDDGCYAFVNGDCTCGCCA
jgi:hypothetical protein